MDHWFNDISLVGNKVKLVPLDFLHKDGLIKAASDGELWKLWFTSVPSLENIDSYIQTALNDKIKGFAFPFVVVDLGTDEIIGSTRFCNATPEHKRLEIGYTWYATTYQQTGVNTESKYLLLKYAFEELECIGVEFRTNWFNVRSRTAISRLGAKQDGILRNHQILADGSYRDTVVFSITNQEWPGVKKSLIYEIEKYNG